MKLLDGGIILLIVITLVAGVGMIAAKMSKKDDGPVEEVAEEVIETLTGQKVDLTPSSPEDTKSNE